MSWPLVIVLIAAGVVAIFWTLHLVWRLHGVWRIHRAGPRPLLATRHRIWHDVHTEEANDLRFGPGRCGVRPGSLPFEFVEELLTGSHPSVSVRDRKDRLWRVKWGAEAKPEAFCVRFAAACGYFAEVTHYVASGRIDGVTPLTRARTMIGEDGRFDGCTVRARGSVGPHALRRTQLGVERQSVCRDAAAGWPEDRRHAAVELGQQGSTRRVARIEHGDLRTFRLAIRDRGAIPDHGLGRSHGQVGDDGRLSRDDGTPKASRRRRRPSSRLFTMVSSTSAIRVSGPKSGGASRCAHVRWFYRKARRITEPALRTGLLASGATEEDAARFARALVARIEALGRVR